MKNIKKKVITGIVTLVLAIVGIVAPGTISQDSAQKILELTEKYTDIIEQGDLTEEQKQMLLNELYQLKDQGNIKDFGKDLNEKIDDYSLENYEELTDENTNTPAVNIKESVTGIEIPAYSNKEYVAINNNVPFFKDTDLTTQSFEYYSELDSLKRCGVAYANISKEIMPTEKRGAIGMVKPSGWHTVRYDDVINGKYLYNRCHLIGYQLAGENANKKNLITGTRSLNVDGMLPFENMVDDFVEATNYHVLYRVTPIYTGKNLVADGVLMEAKSVEDQGKGLSFNVFVYNVQKGVSINYKTGESKLGKPKVTPGKIPDSIINSDMTELSKPNSTPENNTSDKNNKVNTVYVANLNNISKYHSDKNCNNMKNPQAISKKEAVKKGYTPCTKCN